MSDERKINKIDPSLVKVGDVMSFTYYVKVTDVRNNGEELMVEDLDHGLSKMRVQGRELVVGSSSADQFLEEEKVSQTKAAEMLISSIRRPLTVCFEKKDGTERMMRCRFVAQEPVMGRSMVEDLDKMDVKDRLRQVDHRTIKFLIVDGVKYSVKTAK